MVTFKKYAYAWLRDLEITLKYVHYFFNMQESILKIFLGKSYDDISYCFE